MEQLRVDDDEEEHREIQLKTARFRNDDRGVGRHLLSSPLPPLT